MSIMVKPIICNINCKGVILHKTSWVDYMAEFTSILILFNSNGKISVLLEPNSQQEMSVLT